jgi:hypothetical protein
LRPQEQDRWRASVEGFTKDLEYFKKKYSRHLGLQVENYTVAGMAKEEDLAVSDLHSAVDTKL